MLHLRDISLRHRLLIANFTMVFVPIFILTVSASSWYRAFASRRPTTI